ncbi:MAG: 50S ribosomal protein L10 [Nanoarchaeota archaeon]|nr:50S ribosomal protein L10 [Nanoarchaeota archaeon]
MRSKKLVEQIPEVKIKTVENLKNLIKKDKTILIASIKNLPASQYQEISKKLRGKAVVKVPKKNLLLRAIEESKDKEVKKLESKIEDSVAILFSDMDAFELASELLQNKIAAKAKPGQEAPEDIEVQEGPTELVPGPAVSELGNLGIEIKIEKGKISIAKNKIIVKKGQKISAAAADVMAKLDIKPFSIGFIPLAAYDKISGKIYTSMNIDKEGTITKLKNAYSRALPFAVNIGYANKQTIPFLLAKALMHAKALEKNIHTPETSSGEEK